MKSSSLYLVIPFPLFLSVVFFASKSKIREKRFPEEEGGHLLKSSCLYLVIPFPLLSVVLFASKSKISEKRFPEEEGGHLSVKSNRLEGNRRRGAREKDRGEIQGIQFQ